MLFSQIIDIKDSNPEPFFHESPNKKGHIRFRHVKSTGAIGLKLVVFYLGSILGGCQLFVGPRD